MVHVEGEIVIEGPVDEVFDFVDAVAVSVEGFSVTRLLSIERRGGTE